MAGAWEELKEIDISLCGKEVRACPPGKAAKYTGTVLDVKDGCLSVEFRGMGTMCLPKDHPVELKNAEREQEIEQRKKDISARQKKQDELLGQQHAVYAAGPYPLPPQAEESLKDLQAQLDSMDLNEVKPWARTPEFLGKRDYHRNAAAAATASRMKAVHDAASAQCQEYGQQDFNNDLNQAAVDAAVAGNVAALREAAGGCFATFKQKWKLRRGVDPFEACGGDYEEDGFSYGTATLGEDLHLPERGDGCTLLGMAQVANWSDDVLRTLAELGVPETWQPPQAVFVCTLEKTAEDGYSVYDLSGAELSIACSPDSTVKEVAERIRLLKYAEVQILLANGTMAVPEQLLRDVAGA